MDSQTTPLGDCDPIQVPQQLTGNDGQSYSLPVLQNALQDQRPRLVLGDIRPLTLAALGHATVEGGGVGSDEELVPDVSGGLVSERRRVIDESTDGSSVTSHQSLSKGVILFSDKSLFKRRQSSPYNVKSKLTFVV